MLIIRGTKKLRDRVKLSLADPAESSTTVLGDWFANALFWKPQVALLVNERTFLPVVMPLAPAATLLERAPAAIAEVLRRHGVDEHSVAAELAAMSEVGIATTNNRTVLGVMNDFAFHGEIRHTRITDLVDLSIALAGIPIGPLRGRSGFPDRELAAVFGNDRSNVIPFPTAARADSPGSSVHKLEPSRPAAAGSAAPSTIGPGGRQTRSARARSVFQLKVTLLDTKPPVWRRILLDGSATLDEVHEAIQAAFGWWNYHLHEFEVGRERYAVPDPDDDWGLDPPARDEHRARLDKVAEVGSSFRYTYDFGDGWEHKIDVEQVLDAATTTPAPACTGGRRACPPEDCGAPWGYRQLLEILADPSHPEHRERLDWVEGFAQGPFDPEAFDPADFNDNLRNLRLAVFDD